MSHRSCSASHPYRDVQTDVTGQCLDVDRAGQLGTVRCAGRRHRGSRTARAVGCVERLAVAAARNRVDVYPIDSARCPLATTCYAPATAPLLAIVLGSSSLRRCWRLKTAIRHTPDKRERICVLTMLPAGDLNLCQRVCLSARQWSTGFASMMFTASRARAPALALCLSSFSSAPVG